MTTRRKFTGALLAAGTLANFTLVAGAHGPGSGNNGNPCNGHGKADQCHGNGAKKDTVEPPQPPQPPEPPSACKSNARIGQDQTPPPGCRSAGGKEDHVE